MKDKNDRYETRTPPSGSATREPDRDRQASFRLARLILADGTEEGGSCLLFASVLAQQLRHWPHPMGEIGAGDAISLLKAAAREVITEHWEE